MLHVSPLRRNRLDDGADGDSGKWTGEKKRKCLDPSLPSDTVGFADFWCPADLRRDIQVPGYKKYVPPWVGQRVPDPEDPVSDAESLECENILSQRPAVLVSSGELDLESQREVYKRLVLYRMRAHKLSKGVSKDKLGDDELPAFIEDAVSLQNLHFFVKSYFDDLDRQEGHTIDWDFASRYKFEDLGDYHRIVPHNYLPGVGYVYQSWEEYHTLFTTYEMDKDYVKFFEEMSGKLQWLKLYFDYPERSDVWSDAHRRGARQAFKIATHYRHMNFVLAYYAYEDYIWSLRREYAHCEDKDCLFFEIRERVTQRQLSFRAALMELLSEDLFSRHRDLMLYALQEDSCSDLEEQYLSCVEGISGDASEDDARTIIRVAVWKLHKANKTLDQYMARKMEIAESIGLVST